MKAFTISALALLTSMVSAGPAPAGASSYPYQVAINFIGAADGQFTQYFLTNGYGSGICK